MNQQQTRQYLRVGIASTIALGLLLYVFGWLRGTLDEYKSDSLSVVFADARGIAPQAAVTFAGVAIGSVDKVELTPDNKARLRLHIDKKYKVPVGSRFRIVSNLLGGSSTLKVDPPQEATQGFLPPNTEVAGEDGGGIEAALEQSEKLIASLQETADVVKKLVGDSETQGNLKSIVANLRETTDELPAMTRKVQSQLATLSLQGNRVLSNVESLTVTGNRVARNAEGLTRDATGLTRDIRGTIAENRSGIKTLLRSSDEAVSGITALTEQVQETLGSDRLKNNLMTATDNLASISSRIDAVTADIQLLTADPRLSSDLRDTVSNLKETSDAVRGIAERVAGIRLPGEKRRPGDPGPPPKPPQPRAATSLLEPGLVFDSVFDAEQDRLRVDTNFTLLLGAPGSYYRAGIYDFTEGNRINLQIGKANGVPATRAFRYGLIAGKLGVGGDARVGPLDLRLDIFDPNRLTINARAKANLSDTMSATFGLDAVGKGSRAVLGVQIRK